MCEKDLDLDNIIENAEIERPRQVGFSSEDNHVIHERLFSGKNGKEASKIVYRLVFGEYKEKEKDTLLDHFKSMMKEAALNHFKYRTRAVEKAPFKRCLPEEKKPSASTLRTIADLIHDV